ncbi:MAG: PadR family transcriptional regulator [Steroidobacteraceae bacterium]
MLRRGEIFDLGMLEELQRHRYHIRPGTLYPLLHRLKYRGYLKVRDMKMGRARRRLYRATPKGSSRRLANLPQPQLI